MSMIHPNVLKNLTLCIAEKGDTILKKIKNGTLSNCYTDYLWTLTFISYLLPKVHCQGGLTCLPDCNGEINGKASHITDNFINFANKHCDACIHGSDRHVFLEDPMHSA